MCHKRHKSYTKDYKMGPSESDTSTTPAKCLSCSIPSTMLRGHLLHPLNFQPNEHHLYSYGVSHIRTGESMSLLPQQYKIEVLVV